MAPPLITSTAPYTQQAAAIQNVLPGATIMIGHGVNEGSLPGIGVDVEQGVDIGGAYGVAGAPVPLPIAGVYNAGYSTPFQSIFAIGGGLTESITHITADTSLSTRGVTPAGTIIGQVKAGSTEPYSAVNPLGQHTIYFANPSHIEVGFFTSPAAAFGFQGGVDPIPILQAAPAYGQMRTASSGTQTAIGLGGVADPSHWPIAGPALGAIGSGVGQGAQAGLQAAANAGTAAGQANPGGWLQNLFAGLTGLVGRWAVLLVLGVLLLVVVVAGLFSFKES